MKKRWICIVACMWSSLLWAGNSEETVRGAGLVISAGAGVRQVFEDQFEQIYGNYNITVDLEAGLKLSRVLEFFIAGEYFSVSGKLSQTAEDTTLGILPVEAGFRVLLTNRPFRPYISAGVGYYFFNESNDLASVKKSQPGAFAAIGCRIMLTPALFGYVSGKFTYFKVTPDPLEEDQTDVVMLHARSLAGITLSAGFGFQL